MVVTTECKGGWRLPRLRRGAAIEATCMYNGPMAALRIATCSGHATTVKTPMDHGDHINAENPDGKRPLNLLGKTDISTHGPAGCQRKKMGARKMRAEFQPSSARWFLVELLLGRRDK